MASPQEQPGKNRKSKSASAREEPLIITGTDTDLSAEEKDMLERMDGMEATPEQGFLSQARLDHLDNDGEPLNEGSFGAELSGADLDNELAEADDRMEEIGEEDEENNWYSPDNEDEDIPNR